MKTWSDAIDEPIRTGRDSRIADRRRAHVRFLTAAAASLLILFGIESSFPTLKYRVFECGRGKQALSVGEKPFSWDSIKPTESLEFHPCFAEFECAKLELPLDYFNGTHPNSTVSIAIAKLPAKVPVNDPRYGGPVLINPGGPGGSGVQLALGAAGEIQTIIDSGNTPSLSKKSDAKHFDILGFDPRGIGMTEPAARCMPDESSAWSWRLRESTEGLVGSSDAALGRLWSMSHAFGDSCKKSLDAEDEPDIKQYMSTASVARDMIEIAEKHAEWVANKVDQLSSPKHMNSPKCMKSTVAGFKRDSVKLQYWGFSYGTYLGSTFASMFPDRVGRLILDGVVNSHDYNNALGQGSLHDTEKALSTFYTSCVLSGPDNCPLATKTSSVQDIEERVTAILQSLYHNPLALNSPNGPEILTYSDIKALIFISLYSPAQVFPIVAQILAAIEAGGGAILDTLAGGLRPAHIYECPFNGSAPSVFPTDVPEYAILCGDGVDQTGLNITAFEKYWQLLESISPAAGAIWSSLKLKCAAWTIKPVYKYSDAFGGNTSHPILWISNTADPVTPLNSGRIMASRFPGSGMVVQDSAGHCSLSTPTPCTLKAIREYFQTGKIPEPEAVCIPPTSPLSLNSTDPNSPFYDPSLGQPVMLGEELYEEMDAARELQRWSTENNFFGLHAGRRASEMVKNSMLLDEYELL